MRRKPEEIAKMRLAGKVVAEIHEKTRAAIKPGVTTLDLDKISREVLEKRGARSNFLGYHGFPATICTSPNDMIVHGIPGDYVLEEGDIISVDCGAIIDGWHGDAAYTAGVGKISPEAQRLIEVTEAVPFRRHRPDDRWQSHWRHRRGRPEGGRSRAASGGAGVRGPRHRHGHARRAPGAQLRPAGHGSEAAPGNDLRRRADGQPRQRRAPRCWKMDGAS